VDGEWRRTGTGWTKGRAVAEINLLIVDDLEHVRQGLRTILELAGGLRVVGEACNGLEAIRLVDQLQPDVVLMDLAMPQMDGLEATQRIKARHPETGVVMITIHDTDSTREQAAVAGVDALLAKGIDTPDLVRVIHEAARGAHRRDSGRGKARQNTESKGDHHDK
jgi:DNA-binding NarL/FixJ family response regulator